MNERFFELKKEKQDRMLNGIMKIFALYGYRKASTDDIVKEAGVSKGLLFHYFDSKAGAYCFAYEYSARFLSMQLEKTVSLSEHDLFRVMRQVEDAKYVALRKYPYMQRFLLSVEQVSEPEVLEAIEEYRNLVPSFLEDVLSAVDYGRIVEDADGKVLTRTIEYVTRGIMECTLAKRMDPDTAHGEIVSYLSMMASRFTKPEYL